LPKWTFATAGPQPIAAHIALMMSGNLIPVMLRIGFSNNPSPAGSAFALPDVFRE
jgi:hypothetical protein